MAGILAADNSRPGHREDYLALFRLIFNNARRRLVSAAPTEATGTGSAVNRDDQTIVSKSTSTSLSLRKDKTFLIMA